MDCPGLHGVLLQFGANIKWPKSERRMLSLSLRSETSQQQEPRHPIPVIGNDSDDAFIMDSREEENNLNEDSGLLFSSSSFCPQFSNLIVIKGKAIMALLCRCAAGTGFVFFFRAKQQEDLLITGESISKCGKEATLKQSSQERNNLKRHTLRYFFKATLLLSLLLSVLGASFAAHETSLLC